MGRTNRTRAVRHGLASVKASERREWLRINGVHVPRGMGKREAGHALEGLDFDHDL
jgi:hypothetical protein